MTHPPAPEGTCGAPGKYHAESDGGA
jgi:hypothetical protein